MTPALPTRAAPLLAAALLLAAAPAARAQTISLKTVPVASGEQFLVFPTRNLGMGGGLLAVDDPWTDPFVNPGKGARIRGASVFVTPVFYGGARELPVGGRSFPVGLLARSGAVFGGFGFALQEVDDPNRDVFLPPGVPGLLDVNDPPNNGYVYGMLGGTLPGTRTSVGVGAYHATLDVIDGVRQLYLNNAWVEQEGTLDDYRAGFLTELDGGRSIEAVVANTRLDMRHDVTYIGWLWDRFAGRHQVESRLVPNQDRTRTWGVRTRYVQPADTAGGVFAVALTANNKTHPKIPNYDVVRIPRDPGDTWAFNVAVGFARRAGPYTWGLDAAYEPAWTHTWADAGDTLTTRDGRKLGPTDKTVDNRFRFSNFGFGVGLDREGRAGGFQLGLRLKSYRYALSQVNYLEATTRRATESWLEWSPSWGGMLKLSRVEVRYAGRMAIKGDPGFGGETRVAAAPDLAVPGIDFIPAPTGPTWFPDFRVTTHQFSIAIPLGREAAAAAPLPAEERRRD